MSDDDKIVRLVPKEDNGAASPSEYWGHMTCNNCGSRAWRLRINEAGEPAGIQCYHCLVHAGNLEFVEMDDAD